MKLCRSLLSFGHQTTASISLTAGDSRGTPSGHPSWLRCCLIFAEPVPPGRLEALSADSNKGVSLWVFEIRLIMEFLLSFLALKAHQHREHDSSPPVMLDDRTPACRLDGAHKVRRLSLHAISTVQFHICRCLAASKFWILVIYGPGEYR